MADTDVLRIFVSHSHEDDVYCRELVHALREAGSDVWYDEHSLKVGQLIDTIEVELRARPVFVVVLSPAALRSTWVRDETKWAYTQLKRDPTRIILPVMASPVHEDDIWLFLQDFRRVETPGMPYAHEESIQRTLTVLTLPTPGNASNAPDGSQPPANLSDLIVQGKALEAQRKFTEAVAVFEMAIHLAPDSPPAWQNLAYVRVELAHDEEAIIAADRALVLDPATGFTWATRANALNGLGHHLEALAATERALDLDPADAFAWLYKGVALSHLQRYQEALAALERALTIEPGMYPAWVVEAHVLRTLDRDDEAITAVARAQALDPTSAYAWPRQTQAQRLRYVGRVAGLPV